MKPTILAIAAILAMRLCPAQTEQKAMPKVVVYLSDDNRVPVRTLVSSVDLATRMFDKIGVRLEWRHGTPTDARVQRDGAIVVRFADEARSGKCSEALGAALPYQGSTTVLYYECMKWAERNPRLVRVLLAHVLVHEIAHNLQQLARHSEAGIMKAHWTTEDYRMMESAPLQFDDWDVNLIHQGLARRFAASSN